MGYKPKEVAMATDDSKTNYPRIPAKNWWDLRRQFAKRLPQQEVDAAYLKSVLRLNKISSATILIPYFRTVGLIDEEGKTTELALEWRSDSSYATACQKIRESVYPTGLLDVFPSPDPEKDREAVADWFFDNAKVGEAVADQMARFYLLLCEADPSVQDRVKERKPKTITPKKKETKKITKTKEKPGVAEPKPQQGKLLPFEPSLRVDVQIHIPKDATPEQIDQIFKSMAEHIYKIKK